MGPVPRIVQRAVDRVVRRVEVEGTSMLPTFVPGERLTAVRRWRRVRAGDVVVVRDPRDESRWLLKRCVERVGGTLELRGDNPSTSTDSRDFGRVPVRDVAWVVPGARARGSSRSQF